MILQAAAFLKQYPAPTTAQIRVGMAGNLCRCTGYAKIVRAIAAAAPALATKPRPPVKVGRPTTKNQKPTTARRAP
jgi:xanthine dehydrogenase iron-sulfur cluster and FAD-binding subunit A